MTEATPQSGYLRLPEVLKLYPVSESTWYAGLKAGIYPQGHKLSARVTAWKAEDIYALIAAKSAPSA